MNADMKILIVVILLYVCCGADSTLAASYAVARSAAPVLNTPAFSLVFGGVDGKTLKTDRCGQVRELEFTALPGTVFTIRAAIADGKNTIYRVETDEYPEPAGTSLYLDSRFVDIREVKPQLRARKLPSKAKIIAALKASVGIPYVWGGNVQGGVSELLELFYGGVAPVSARPQLSLAGLDCSGLLYQATDGWTPRNTSRLVSFGKAVDVAGKSLEEIVGSLEPLDLIVWNGHVIIVLDRETVIESRLECGQRGNGGVMTTAVRKRFTEIMRSRRPAYHWPTAGKQRDIFVVRRWY
jgi:cell wall-associated NlpC family hydrolase